MSCPFPEDKHGQQGDRQISGSICLNWVPVVYKMVEELSRNEGHRDLKGLRSLRLGESH